MAKHTLRNNQFLSHKLLKGNLMKDYRLKSEVLVDVVDVEPQLGAKSTLHGFLVHDVRRPDSSRNDSRQKHLGESVQVCRNSRVLLLPFQDGVVRGNKHGDVICN